MSPEYLVKVEANANNNKYYRMIPHENGTWTAEYGRIGSRPQKREYDASQFEKKLNEKLRKGYARQTEVMQDLIQKEDKAEIKYKPIKNKSVAAIAKRLQDMARKAVSDNYTISSSKVTKAMLDEAQSILAYLVHEESVRDFNEELLRLFTVIPRKMSNVSENLAQSESDFADILVKEQNLLDVMKGQVIENTITDMRKETQETYDGTVLDSIGVSMEPCDAEEIELIKRKLGRCAKHFKQAWRVVNHASSVKFDMYTKERKLGIAKQKLLWHGSRNENWWSILQTGLVLKPTNAVITGKMFGYGIYYATKAAKSIGYTSMTGSRWAGGSSSTAFMALMSVAYGKPYDVYSFDSKYYDFDYKALQKACPGADCLHAHAGKGMLREDEIIVYREDQCTIRYLVELYS